MSAAEAETLLREAGWTPAMDYDGKTPVVLIARQGSLYAITGVDPHGENRAGARADPVSLALDLIAMAKRPEPAPAPSAAVGSEPQPEPVAPPAEPSPDLTAEVEALKAQLAASEAARIKAEQEAERLKQEQPAPPADDAVPLPPLDEKLADWGDLEAEAELTTDDLLSAHQTSPEEAEQVVRKLTRARRKRFTELLNVELAELQQERGGPGENLKREGEIEALLGLFARVGEM